MSYEALKRFAVGSLLAYCILGFASAHNNPRGETYPFFSWSLFSYIPNETYGYTIAVHEILGEKHDPPLMFEKMRPYFDALSQSPTDYTPIIRNLGLALKHKDEAEAAVQRKKLERIFSAMPFAYDLFSIRYDPVLYWRIGTFKEKRLIATFSNETP